MSHSPMKVNNPLIINNSNPILNSPKISDWYLSIKKESVGAIMQIYGTKWSFTLYLVKIPKANKPSSGP